MNKKKLYVVLSIVTVSFYLLTTILVFISLRKNTESNLKNNTAPQLNMCRAYADSEISTEKAAAIINALQSEYDGSSVGAVAITKTDGTVIAKSGAEIVFFDNEISKNGAILIGDLLTAEKKDEVYKFIKSAEKYSTKSIELYEKDGVITPVSFTLIDRESGKTLKTVLTDIKPDKVYENKEVNEKFNVVFFELGQSNANSKYTEKFYSDLNNKTMSSADYEVTPITVDGEDCMLYYGSFCDLNNATLKSKEFILTFAVESVFFALIYIFAMVIMSVYYKKNAKAEAAKLYFISASAHELKTPLAIIDNRCEMLIENIAPEKKEEYINSICKETGRMNNLIKSFINYNTLVMTDSVIMEAVDFKELVKEEIKKYNELSKTKGIIMTVNIPESEVHAKCNKELIGLVVDNIVSNAVKHSPENAKVTVSLSVSNRHAVFKVLNEGSKIEAENAWLPLYKQDASRNGEKKSTGMGLAISGEILKLHRFKYGCSNKTSGVEFFFEFKTTK